MLNISLSEKFALIALDAQRSNHHESEKMMSLRSLAASYLLEKEFNIVDGEISPEISNIFKNNHLLDNTPLEERLNEIPKMKKNDLLALESHIVKELKSKDLIEEKKSLISCDLEFETAGIVVKEYVSDEMSRNKIITALGQDLFEQEFKEIQKTSVILFYLCKEAGILQEIFPNVETSTIKAQYEKLFEENTIAETFYHIQVHKKIEGVFSRFIKTKRDKVSTEVGTGINFVYPMIDRPQAVFIATEKYFPDAEDRLKSVEDKLAQFGVSFEVVQEGAVNLIKINNVYYKTMPYYKKYRMPVHGVQLKKYLVS